MHTHTVDVAVIGAGTAGLAAYRTAHAEGRRAVIIEGGPGGTTCAREGCMPSKLLIAAAHAAHAARDADAFGVRVPEVDVDFDAVMRRVRSERDRFVGFVLRSVDGLASADRVRGWARFTGRSEDGRLVIDVAGSSRHMRVEARSVVIATGSSDHRLPFEPALGDLVSHAADVFEWTERPERLVVFGPGAIGLELGLALQRLGSEVEVLGLGGFLGPLTDPDVKRAALEAFSRQLDIDPDVEDMEVHREGDEVVVTRTLAGRRFERRFDHAVVAVGRRPNLDPLDLAALGVRQPEIDRETLQLGALPIFVAGDATGDRALLHEAADEGRIAGRNAARFPDVEPGERRTPIGIVFADPQLALVGSPLAALDPTRIAIGSADYGDQGRSRVMRENRGWLSVYVDCDTGRMLGAELAHPRAEHLAHTLAWAHQLGLTVHDMLALPFYHPVIEEGLRTALRDARAQLCRAAA